MITEDFLRQEKRNMLYKTTGTCSKAIEFEVDGNKITKCEFMGGCMGNTQGVAKLVTGRDIDEVISTLEGIDCNGRGTSCPDQLAKALAAYKESAV